MVGGGWYYELLCPCSSGVGKNFRYRRGLGLDKIPLKLLKRISFQHIFHPEGNLILTKAFSGCVVGDVLCADDAVVTHSTKKKKKKKKKKRRAFCYFDFRFQSQLIILQQKQKSTILNNEMVLRCLHPLQTFDS